MKSLIIIYLLVFLSSSASADVYTWEDANGVNFTDDASSIPEMYREEPAAVAKAHFGNSSVPARADKYPQTRRAVEQENRDAARQAGLEQHRQAAQAKNQRQTETRDFESTLKSLAKFVVIWIVLGACLFLVWLATMVDIIRSTFTTPSHKTVWMLLVLFLPLLGMVPYMILGLNQKRDLDRQPFGTSCTVNPG